MTVNFNNYIPYRQAGGAIKPSGRVWPNGEFSIGYARAGGAEREFSVQEYARESVAHLGSSLPSNSHRESDHGAPKRGTRGMTSYGKKVLRNAVWRMQRLYGKRSLAFVTLTLPGITYEESWNVSSNWSQIVRVFYQKLGRELERAGLPTSYAGCTEMQPGRLQREGHPCLHLHFVIVGRIRARGGWALRPCDFRELWSSVVARYLYAEYDWQACENVQMVRKDASSYMAKYVSKGCSMGEPPRSDETGWSLPTAWYNVSLGLRRWVIENIRKHPGFIEMIERECLSGDLQSQCHYLFAGVIEEMPGTGPHYWVGKFKGDVLRDLIDIWWTSVDAASRQVLYNRNRLRQAGKWSPLGMN